MREGYWMRAEIDDLIGRFEAKNLTRRELVASLAAMVTGAASRASAQAPATGAAAQVAQGRTINHVSLAVSDVEKSAAFYAKLLGLKEVSRPGNGGINLGLGTSFLGIYKNPHAGRLHPFLPRG